MKREACEVCGEELAERDGPGRPARFCSSACRTRAYRGRQQEVVRANKRDRLDRAIKSLAAERPKTKEAALVRRMALEELRKQRDHIDTPQMKYDVLLNDPEVGAWQDAKARRALAEQETRAYLRGDPEPLPDDVSPAVRVLARSEDDRRRERIHAEYRDGEGLVEGWVEQ